MSRRLVRGTTAAALGSAMFLAGVVAGGLGTAGSAAPDPAIPGFSRVVFLGHVNDPRVTPGFPGDPAFSLTTVFTVPQDGFYLQYVREGEHTGTHWSAPCHFHVAAPCADELAAGDLVLPAAVVDVREQVAADPDYAVTPGDLEAWEARYGPMPAGGAVIAWTGCARFWARGNEPGEPTYYNCGSGRRGFHQPGFSIRAIRWLIDRGVLGRTGAVGTDTFGPDPGTDPLFRESALTLHRHRIVLENLAHLGSMPAAGGWVVVGGPVNRNGSGSPATVYGLVP